MVKDFRDEQETMKKCPLKRNGIFNYLASNASSIIIIVPSNKVCKEHITFRSSCSGGRQDSFYHVEALLLGIRSEHRRSP